MKSRIAVFVGVVCVAALGIWLSGISRVDEPNLKKVSLQLHWIPDAHQLGFWIALDKGFYKEVGIDAEIRPGGLDANPIKDVVSGAVTIGQIGGIEQAVVAVSEGLPVKAIASIHRDTPHALISLESAPIRSKSDFAGKTIAVAFGDTAEVLLKSYMKRVGIDQSTVKFVPYRFDLSPLLTGQVQAVTGFSTGQPATLVKLGKRPVVLAYKTSGLQSYGYTLIASDQTLNNQSETIRKFISATRRGWKFAFENQNEAIELFEKRFGDKVDSQLVLEELKLISAIMLQSGGSLADWKIDSQRIDGVIEFLADQNQIKRKPASNAVFKNIEVSE